MRGDPATKKRLARAKASARVDLEERGFVVFSIADSAEEMIAIDPETGKAKLIRVCLGSVSSRDTAFLEKHKGVRVEFWQRQAGEKRFIISRA